ncbi:MAG: hypothetical protein V4692_13035, partial [Bdellovibrionota bacterium]
MIRILFFISALGLLPALANAEGCGDEVTTKYIIKGELSDTSLGARTWDLMSLSRDAKAGDVCAKPLYATALGEAEKYWNHIDAKYSCDSVSEKCPAEKHENVTRNKQFISLIKFANSPETTPGE